MKLATIRKWKRDALEMAHDIRTSTSVHVASLPNTVRLYENFATVCSLLERRMKDEEFASKIKDGVRKGIIKSSKEDSSLKS